MCAYSYNAWSQAQLGMKTFPKVINKRFDGRRPGKDLSCDSRVKRV